MDLQLRNRTALVTGASQGIGRAIALELAREGAYVAVAARRKNLLDELAAEIERTGGLPPVVIEADLYNPETPLRLAAAAKQHLGRVDILVNAAGGSRPIPFEAPIEKWEEGMTLNFYRLRELSHAVIPGMIENGWGRIINITGSSEPRGINAANSAKAAVHAWAKGLSREMARHGITVNSIQPGRIISEQILRMHPTEENRKRFAEENIPAGRFGEPAELANLVVFLASPLAGYITGTVIPVDGGMSRFAF
ncbi:MAG: 3-oxoacyl-ACP reductase [Betaproteobacteria bacterium RIFCSPLOWO2_12_FULL_62_58]|nr:MAG: 3-oxoacyl-ACP reductase [Betaproteobacteria bacterium RIFCSPLOWO2_12_FULL_62_58]